MADKSNSAKPWSSICKLNDTPRGTMTVPRHYQKSSKTLSKDQGVSGSPIVGMILPLISIWHHPAHKKPTTPPSMAMALALCDGPYSWNGLLPESKQIYLLPITVSLTEFSCNETSRTWASWVLKPGNMGLDQTQVPVIHNWVAKHSRVPTMWFESQT